MIVTLNEVLDYAEKNACAIGAFNTPNLECISAVLSAAEEKNVPVIISHAEVHEYAAPLDTIGPVMTLAAKRSKAAVCVHLDHCEHLDYMARALEMGFTGVMYDGSALDYGENAANTIAAVALAGPYGAGVEAELGRLASREDGGAESGPQYTDPDLAGTFARETGIAALAPSFGTAHGIYRSKPVLDLDLVGHIREKTGLPLVMHGGSGVSPGDYRIAIKQGIRKINYYSYMSRAGVTAAKALLDEITYFHDAALAAQNAMREDVVKAMDVFYEPVQQHV